ncbi:MAG: hypothetical protein DI535_05865 [Citrobacter freundii]|nr:MAG: hypothetical protein DI535_05865 [Citrobacter freundii]
MKYLMVFIMLVTLFSCTDNPTIKGNKNEIVEVNGLQVFLKNIPEYTSIFNSASDTLMFGFSKAATEFDTSWSLIVTKKDSDIKGRYSELIRERPSLNLKDSISPTLYHGYIFDIDIKYWNNFVKKTGLVTYTSVDTSMYTGCFHCPRYLAYYNSKCIVSGKNDYSYLKNLDSLLRNDILLNNNKIMNRYVY